VRQLQLVGQAQQRAEKAGPHEIVGKLSIFVFVRVEGDVPVGTNDETDVVLVGLQNTQVQRFDHLDAQNLMDLTVPLQIGTQLLTLHTNVVQIGGGHKNIYLAVRQRGVAPAG